MVGFGIIIRTTTMNTETIGMGKTSRGSVALGLQNPRILTSAKRQETSITVAGYYGLSSGLTQRRQPETLLDSNMN